MDKIDIAIIEELARRRDGWQVSAYLPTHPASPEGQQDALRLKNLLTHAEETLVEKGMRPPEARELLQPATELLHDGGFWNARSRGLAVFVGEGVFRRFRVPLQFEEEVSVDRRFHIKQLLPLALGENQVYVLALSRNKVRLLAVTRDAHESIVVKGFPKNMEEALNIEGADRGEQVHAATHSSMGSMIGKQAAVFHGQGGRADALKDDIAQYFRIIDSALRERLHEEQTPLMIAGVDYELPIFREICSYPHLVEEQLPGNFDHASDHQIYEQAQPLVRQILQKPQRETARRYREIADTSKASDDLLTILVAAHRGRIDTLFVDFRAEMLGHFDAEAETLDRRHTADADDLVDLAAAQTLLGSGTVHAMERDDMPCPGPIAAIFRY